MNLIEKLKKLIAVISVQLLIATVIYLMDFFMVIGLYSLLLGTIILPIFLVLFILAIVCPTYLIFVDKDYVSKKTFFLASILSVVLAYAGSLISFFGII